MKLLPIAVRPIFCLVLLLVLSQGTLKAGNNPLEESMDKMEDAKKELYQGLKTPVAAEKSKYLKQANILKTEAELSKNLDPQIVAKLPADQKDKIVADYRKAMDEFIQTTQELIEAIDKEQWDQAKAAVAKLKEEEKAGHQAYRPKKEK